MTRLATRERSGMWAAVDRHHEEASALAPVVAIRNGIHLPIGDGLWKIPTTLVARRDMFADPVSGNAAVWSVLDEGGSAVLLSARLRVPDRRITEIETVVARKGSHALFSPETFAAITPVFQQVSSRPNGRPAIG